MTADQLVQAGAWTPGKLALLGAGTLAIGGAGALVGARFIRPGHPGAHRPIALQNPLSGAGKVLLVGGAVAAIAIVAALLRRSTTPGCVMQAPQPFLIRTNYQGNAEAAAAAVRYRTERYGYFPGFGDPSWNPHPPSYYAVPTTFMGLPVTLNRRILPALRCVEAEIKRTCTAYPYAPKRLSGLRLTNTFHGSEVSNHVYGIAIDIDPGPNSCCGCVPPWNQDPRCKVPATSEYDRMVMPKCWVDVFERYGFYWLGHDPQLRDTMHFEFLGDPSLLPAT